jgi:hypothetical protein
MNIYWSIQYMDINFMFPRVTQVKIKISILKCHFDQGKVTLFRMVNSFYRFKQFFILIFKFLTGNFNFLTFMFIYTKFPLIIWKLLYTIRKSVKFWCRNDILWIYFSVFYLSLSWKRKNVGEKWKCTKKLWNNFMTLRHSYFLYFNLSF